MCYILGNVLLSPKHTHIYINIVTLFCVSTEKGIITVICGIHGDHKGQKTTRDAVFLEINRSIKNRVIMAFLSSALLCKQNNY